MLDYPESKYSIEKVFTYIWFGTQDIIATKMSYEVNQTCRSSEKGSVRSEQFKDPSHHFLFIISYFISSTNHKI
jgi:hypothetical protein